MISKQYVKDLDFNDMSEFYDYVIESRINGNYAQTKEFIKKMSNTQYIQFLIHCRSVEYEDDFEFTRMREL